MICEHGDTPPKEFTGLHRWYIFDANTIIVKNGSIPPASKDEQPPLPLQNSEYLGTDENATDLYCGLLAPKTELTPPWERLDFRSFYKTLSQKEQSTAGTARQILFWKNANRFCGKCGASMVRKKDERAMICSHCTHTVYPRISPAVIVAIRRKSAILLAHNARFPTDRYSIIAGFVEPGETPEMAVEREVAEEVGIRVKNIRYVESQAYPFPDSLMLGFTAEYAAGEICPDGTEILRAGWFEKDELEEISLPSSSAISRWLIDGVFAGRI
ncbi:MAG: NAD(+) diphosphatase [Fibrobacterota bacterium]